VRGPWGKPPLDVIQRSDSLIFFATSTGAAFNMPILQSIIKTPVAVRRVRFYWVVRHFSQICWFEEGLNSALEQAESRGIDLAVQVFVTSLSSLERDPSEESTEDSRQRQVKTLDEENEICHTPPSRTDFTLDSISSKTSDLGKQPPLADPPLAFSPTKVQEPSVSGQQGTNSIISPVLSGRANEKPSFVVYSGRPYSLDDLVRPTVEESDGETAIIGCGSGSFLAQLRNYTAALSDERAVHKGTGAQGIFLFVENYGW
jgi:hypothetical protein